MSYSNGPKMITNGLVLYLDAANPRSYVSGSSTVYDLSGNNNSSSLFNGPTYTSENRGALVFDGSNDYGTIPNLSSSISSGFTINCWIKLLTIGSEKQYFGVYGPAPNNDEVNVGIIYYLSKNTFFFYCRPYGGNMFSTTIVEANKMYYVSTLVNNPIGKRRMYVNGILESEDSVTFTNWPNATAGFGATNNGGGRPINAKIYNFSIYNRGLSADEIKQNYTATKGRYIL